jgi:hypothetical protein
LGASVRRCLADSKTITGDEFEARPSYDKMDNAEVIKTYGHTSRSDVYQYMIHCNIETDGQTITFIPTCRIEAGKWEYLRGGLTKLNRALSRISA